MRRDRCRVCYRSKDLFKRFPSCKRANVDTPRTGREFKDEGFIFIAEEGSPFRKHVAYCSPVCYTHTTLGHWVREAKGRRGRRRRAVKRWAQGKGPNPRGTAWAARRASGSP